MQTIKNSLITLMCVLLISKIVAQPIPLSPEDSVKKAKAIQKWHIKSTARLHNKGVFLYSGRLSSENPAFDINFTYNRRTWGFMIYKAIDLTDHTTSNNFTLATLFKNFKVSERLTITPYAGAFLEQAHSFADWGSDVVVIAIANYKLNPFLSIEYTTLLPSLIVEPESRDWVNRFRLLYSHKHWDITGSFWHNNQVFDQDSYTSSAFTVSYSRIRLSDSFNLNFSATELAILKTSNEVDTPKEQRFVLTAAIQFTR